MSFPPGMAGMEDDSGGKRPRGKMTPYACFVKVIRAEHKKKHPNESIVFSEFSKKCAEKWRQMTEKEKKRFQEMSEKDKERFNKEMSYYSAAGNMGQMNMGGGKMGGKGSRKRKRPKDPNAPKRALSAFMWFCKAERPNVKGANPELKMGQIAKVLSEQWKVCPNKHVYEGQADNDKERYREAMVHWKKIAPPPSTSKHHYQDGMFGHHDTHHHHKVPRDPDLPKRPLSAFMWFCKAERPAVRDANPELKVGQIAQILSEHWKACPDKTRFEEEANADKLRYREQMEAFKAQRKSAPAATGTSHGHAAAPMGNMNNMGNMGMMPQQAMGMNSGHHQMGGMVPHPQAAMGMIPHAHQQQMLHSAPHPQSQLAHHSHGQMQMPPKQQRMGMEESSGSDSESDEDSDDDEEESD
ncbi:high mobility group protein DSP1-like isoform X2 [Lineus longissimus]|uniref:high mobility group protein DSP1-like isoform X2 n=1 Tax=Lineus longissimus TaxID=88925 RepID=UPI00315D1FDB